MLIARAVCLTAVVLSLPAGPVRAQEEHGSATTARMPPAAPPVRVEEPIVDLSFAGGTLGAFLAQLRLEAGGLNIVAPAIVDEIDLPKIELKRAPVIDALQAVARVAAPGYGVEAARSNGVGGSPVYTVLAQARSGPPGVLNPGRLEVRVFSIRVLTAELTDAAPPPKVETVLSAIEAGSQVQGRRLEVSYHETSGLVFVRGTAEQVALVEEILSSLERDRHERFLRSRPPSGGEAPAKKDPEKKDPEKKDPEKKDPEKKDPEKKDADKRDAEKRDRE
jgi:hypothetical protein